MKIYASAGKGLKLPCKWGLVKTTDNIRIMPVSVFKVVVMERGGQRKQSKENYGKTEKYLKDMSLDSVTIYGVYKQDRLRWPGSNGLISWALLSLSPSPTYSCSQIEDADIDPFGTPYTPFSLLKWLPWSQQKNLLNHISSILNDAILSCQWNSCN